MQVMAKAKVFDEEVSELIRETSSYEIIGKAAETACFKIFHSAGVPESVREGAKLKVIRSNLRFALKLAIDYHNMTGMPVGDFFADGKLGLLEAFYRYDWTTGVKFGSYAIWYLRTRMSSTVAERDLVRVPVRLRKKVIKALKDGVPMDAIKYGKEAEASIMHTISMDTPITSDTDDEESADITVSDAIPDVDAAAPDYGHAQQMLHDRLESEMKCSLSPDECKLLRHLYGIDREESSLDDVAMETGNSKDWVRRAKAKALAKLRESHGLDDFREGIN